MRIQALSSHTLKSAPNINFKQKQANVSYPENDINSIYSKKAAALCGEYENTVSSEQKQANVSYPENDINSIYSKKAAALCGQYDVNLSGFASIKQTGN